MIIYKSEDKFDRSNEYVATVGFFDGVHRGHRFLLDELKKVADSQRRKSLVFTFSQHPRKVLHDNFQPVLLNSLDEKLAQLATTGIDVCVVLNFTLELAALSAHDFLKQVLFDKYNVRTLIVGHDHRLGHNREEGFEDYFRYGEEMGMEVIKARRFVTDEYSHISSSEIRLALQKGEIAKANNLLTYPYTLTGKVINGFQVGRKIGFPTANLKPDNSEKLVPSPGVYAVQIVWNGRSYNGMMNIGFRPTLNNGGGLSFEVHIFDFEENIYNQTIAIKFIRKIREEQKFKNVDALIEQLIYDKQIVLNILGKKV
ncbi:MAG: riboflavin biosynthesis protein RibF [Paludibacter sp.]|nr:riboflavin biosynthesis protein RibF [Paludibacter sp.]